MAVDKKVIVLALGDIEEGKRPSGVVWYRRNVQMFSGEIAGRVQVYDTKEKLEAMQAGEHMAEYVERNGDFGNIDISFGNFRPVRPQAKPTNV